MAMTSVPSSNGEAECAVKINKGLLKKETTHTWCCYHTEPNPCR